jgi:hypothetical protein
MISRLGAERTNHDIHRNEDSRHRAGRGRGTTSFLLQVRRNDTFAA